MITNLRMIQSLHCVNIKRTKEAISCSICEVVQRNRIRLGTPVWVFAPICLDSSDSLLKLERIPIFTSILQNELRKLQWNPPSHDSSGLVRNDGGTVLSAPLGQHRLIGNLSKVDRNRAERMNQELQKNWCQIFQTEAAIDLACDQDQVLRDHFLQTARSHREEILSPDLKEIYEPGHLVQEEDEDDETERMSRLLCGLEKIQGNSTVKPRKDLVPETRKGKNFQSSRCWKKKESRKKNGCVLQTKEEKQHKAVWPDESCGPRVEMTQLDMCGTMPRGQVALKAFLILSQLFIHFPSHLLGEVNIRRREWCCAGGEQWCGRCFACNQRCASRQRVRESEWWTLGHAISIILRGIAKNCAFRSKF